MSLSATEPVFRPMRLRIHSVGFWLAMAFGALALLLASFGFIAWRSAQALSRDGVNARGTIVEREIERSRRSNGTYRQNYYLEVRFATTTGQATTGRFSVPQARYNSARVGDVVALRYVAHDPSIAELDEGDRADEATRFGAGAGVFGLLGLAGWVWSGRSVASLRRAIMTGERRRARVAAHRSPGRRARGQVFADWIDAQGNSGSTGVLKLADAPAVGAEIDLRIDPRTGRGWWMGDPSLRP